MCRKITLIMGLFIVAGFGVVTPASAQGDVKKATQDTAKTKDVFNNSGLSIPRFVSLRDDKVFVRSGPGLRFPKKWIYQREALPVEIIREFDTWRKIQDKDGEEGWIHQSMLSGKRTAIIDNKEPTMIYKKPDAMAKTVAIVENGNIITLDSCDIAWCKGQVKGFSGFISRNSLWGVYQKEELE